jgi:predicted ester cyclase
MLTMYHKSFAVAPDRRRRIKLAAGTRRLIPEGDCMSIKDTADKFFAACETGQGWEGCQPYCHPAATFAAQATALAGVSTLQAYTDWMKGIFTPLPDASYEIKSFAVDEERNNVTAYGVFRATHTGAGGPVSPTGKRTETDYVYVMQFDGGKIRHLTKIWNDGLALKQLGWA